MVRIIKATEKLDCEKLLGTFLDSSHYDEVIDTDTDAHLVDTTGICDETNVLFKFRKNVFNIKEQRSAYEGLVGAAGASQNRGLAAGPKGENCGNRDWLTEEQAEILDFLRSPRVPTLDGSDVTVESIKKKYENGCVGTTRGMVWLRSAIQKDEGAYEGFFDKWLERIEVLPVMEQQEEANRVIDKYVSDTTYANPVFSGIAGYFDRYPRIPYGRATSYTEHHFDLFKKAYPFLESLSEEFMNHLPERYKRQHECVKKLDSRFVVGRTVFTTITVNRNFRTAAHRDAGDLHEGFSNLSVLTNGEHSYDGAYLVLPEYRVAINIRPGDLLLINNHGAIHGNTELIGDENMERISIVCYFREKMLQLGSYEYEDLRKKFVDHRRLNKSHELWKPLWNGVSHGMWDSPEWADYLREHGMVKESMQVGLENFNDLTSFAE